MNIDFQKLKRELLTPESLIAHTIILTPLILAFFAKSSTKLLILLLIFIYSIPTIVYFISNTWILLFAPALNYALLFGVLLFVVTLIFYNNKDGKKEMAVNFIIILFLMFLLYNTHMSSTNNVPNLLKYI